jgi:3-methyladenine DNA glycosylase AlkD
MTRIIEEIRAGLEAAADEKTQASSTRFFKEEIKLYGVKTAQVTKISKTHFARVKDLRKDEIFALCEELLESGYLEEAGIAANWSYWISKRYEPGDFAVFERWVERYIDNWAKCDTLCNHTVGAFIERYPDHVERLKKWTRSENRWVKRAAAVSLIVPAKKGEFLTDIFEITDSLLLDGDDMVQKGYGWLLKEASRQHQVEVFDYVLRNKAVMPRTSLRYAIEKMPQEMRKKAMER